ncbi:MAG: hypothetical protein QME96_17610 [Myxococcota bacterium]|nr:hypothetical protein [Myxococcota bacterium]
MPEERDFVDEIRAVGERLFEEHGGTLESFCAWIRELEAQHPEKMARLPPPPRELTDEDIEEFRRTFAE